MARITTHNLDEAAYLALSGYIPKVKRTGPVAAEMSFDLDELGRQKRLGFWRGEGEVTLSRWLAVRQALKHEVSRQSFGVSVRPDKDAELPEVRVGTPYWYREGADVMHALFGNSQAHMQRLAEGNFYATREDASLKRNPVQRV